MAKAKYPVRNGLKVCSKCLKELPISEFYFQTVGRFSYYNSRCRSCTRTGLKKWYDENTQQYYSSQREWVKRNREHQDFLMWRSHVKRKYNLTTEQAHELLKDQHCQLCGTDNPRHGHKRMCVDHDHKTGRVRGILCHECNRALGRVDAIPDWCERVKAYLAKANALTSANTPRA